MTLESRLKHWPGADSGPRNLATAGALLGGFTFLWVLIEALGSFANVPALEIVWFRYGTHLALLLAMFGWRRSVRVSAPLPQHILRAFTMLGMPLCFLGSLSYLSISETMRVFWVYPVLLLAIATVHSEFRSGWRDLAAVTLGFAGSQILTRSAGSPFRLATVLPLGMALCLLVYSLMTRAMREEDRLAKLFHTALWVFLALSLYMPFIWRTPTLRGLAAMASIGALGLVALYFLDAAFDLAHPAAIAAFAYLQLLWALLAEGLLGSLRLSPASVTAGILIAAGILCYFLPNRRRAAMNSR